MSINLDKVLVVTFSQGERTEELNNFCFDKLGFKNRITLDSESGFDDKFLEFARIAVDSEYDFFIRNDADRLVFDGILKLLKLLVDDSTLSWATGYFYDYLMDRSRCGTPSVHRKDNLKFLTENPHLMKNSQKPETDFARSINKKFKLLDTKILTNLHDYDQYPSKVCNTLINRYYRNHWDLYNIKKLKSHKVYTGAVQAAIEYIDSAKKRKDSMDYLDFSYLNKDVSQIKDSELEVKYDYYKSIYESINI